MKKIISSLLIATTTLLTQAALAQNTGGVFPPIVNEGHSSWQYRAAFDPDTDRFAQRLHYQRSIDGDLMWRVLGQTRKTADSDVDFDFFQAELFWELSEDGAPWRTGLRFDARVRDRGRPGLVGVHWTNHLQLDADTRVRFLVMSLADVGDGARDGVFFETRADVAHRLASGIEIGVEMYNRYGSTRDFGDFDEQSHQLGPMVTVPVGGGWSLFGGLLLGLSDGASDQDFRLWVTRAF